MSRAVSRNRSSVTVNDRQYQSNPLVNLIWCVILGVGIYGYWFAAAGATWFGMSAHTIGAICLLIWVLPIVFVLAVLAIILACLIVGGLLMGIGKLGNKILDLFD